MTVADAGRGGASGKLAKPWLLPCADSRGSIDSPTPIFQLSENDSDPGVDEPLLCLTVLKGASFETLSAIMAERAPEASAMDCWTMRGSAAGTAAAASAIWEAEMGAKAVTAEAMLLPDANVRGA